MSNIVIPGRITGYDGRQLTIAAPLADEYLLVKRNIRECEIRLTDGRSISADQRKAIYATLRDIALWTGYVPEETKQIMKYDFMAASGADVFSLSDTDMTTAYEFMNHLLDFCLFHGIPLSDKIIERSPDIGRTLYSCLIHKKCCICGGKAELHHVDAVGSGRLRKEIIHIGMEALPLCRKHHTEIHTIGRSVFCEQYHVFGIKLDEYLCGVWKLKAA